MPSALPEPRSWGGRRPGAGAPRGNLNGLKTGRHSKRLVAIAKGIAAVPEVKDILLEMNRQQRRQQRRAERLAYKTLLQFIGQMPAESNQVLAYLKQTLADTEKQQHAKT